MDAQAHSWLVCKPGGGKGALCASWGVWCGCSVVCWGLGVEHLAGESWESRLERKQLVTVAGGGDPKEHTEAYILCCGCSSPQPDLPGPLLPTAKAMGRGGPRTTGRMWPGLALFGLPSS